MDHSPRRPSIAALVLAALAPTALLSCGEAPPSSWVQAADRADAPASPSERAEQRRLEVERNAASIATVPWDDTPMVLRASKPFTGDLDEIRKRGVLRVLVSYSRTNFFIADGELRGFEYELFRELEKALAKDRPRGEAPAQIAFLPVPFDELLPALAEGRGDVAAASLTITPEREALVAFTDPYLTDVDEVIVSHAGSPPVADWADLAGEEVHVAPGTVFRYDLDYINEQLIDAGLEPMRIVEGGRGLKTEDMLELVHSGAFRFTIADRFVAELWSSVLDGLRVEDELVAREQGEIAWAVRRENPELRDALSGYTRANRKGTMIGNVLFQRYFANRKWIRNPLADEERSRLAPFRDDLQRHSTDFGFDWRLIAAQAYQESGLDPNAVSRSGAVGLMQLLPSTAKDMGVTDLRDPERNLYAGVKYMDWLRTHFFDEPQLAPEAQLDFCLAAYNAGPGRVRRWRAEAPARGLDPDRWFGNVELLALEDVGLQPVQYVGNINKYFILYRLALDDLAAHDRARAEIESELDAR
ncbi:MAG: transporter substrate-binding domain-containing protein [Planctomycetota bacterium]